tara:strand:- start:8507 stop:9934 length:1428 start_codon:yes stop_codon:yes gene_type:complete
MKVLLVLLGMVVMAAPVLIYAVDATTTPNAPSTLDGANCSTIEANWKENGKNILGANQKVSDVVLNACDAIGGCTSFNSGCRYRKDKYGRPLDAEAQARAARGCTGNGGATRSQHLEDNALDVSVPKGKEAEFITLAICGLRKVNGCQGGVGLYSSGAIHIDVRSGRSIWSDDFGSGSVAKLRDVNAKNILYGFQAGECTGGSIATNYDDADEKMYGDPVEYKIPERIFQTPQSGESPSSPSFLNPDYYTNNTKNTELPLDDITFEDPYVFDPFGANDDFSTTVTNNTSRPYTFLQYLQDNEGTTNTTAYQPYGVDRAVTCAETGLFGTKLFSSCKRVQDERIDERSNPETGSVERINPIQALLFGDVAENESPVRNTQPVYGPGTTFYAVHTPTDTYREDGYAGYESNPTFVAGEGIPQQQPINFLEESTRIATQGARYGAYFGLIHGFSPMVVGSAPRTLLRLGQGVRVNNPF